MAEPDAGLHTRVYSFPPGVIMRLRSARREVMAYFDAEYAAMATDDSQKPHLDVLVGRDWPGDPDPEAYEYRGRHKTVTWRLRISGLDDETTRVCFDGKGTMAISFLQTFYLEPLIRLRVAEQDAALVHAGAIENNGGCVLLVGGTGVGKTTIATLQAVRSGGVFGDNYVVVTPDGGLRGIPRRLRLYSDFPKVNPEGYQRLARSRKLRLKTLKLIKTFSLGYAGLPLRIPLSELDPGWSVKPEGVPLNRLFLLDPHPGSEIVGPNRIETETVIQRIQAIGDEEAKRLSPVVSSYVAAHPESRWRSVGAKEVAVLRKAFHGLPAYQVLVPRVSNPGVIASRLLDILRAD
jgi:hypothetical protein